MSLNDEFIAIVTTPTSEQADGGSNASKNVNSTQLPLASTTTAAMTQTLIATLIEVITHVPVDSPVLRLAFDTLFALHDTQAWVGLNCASLPNPLKLVPAADPNMRNPQTAHIVLKMIAGQAEARVSEV
eukprot:1233872-Prymnesium_polylepis.2